MAVMLALTCAPLDARQAPAQSNPAAAGGTGEVRGRIMSGVPPAPVAGASVKLTGGGLIKTSAADENGRFVFTKLPPGQYTISVSSNGMAVTAFGGSAPRAATIDLADGAHVDRGDLVLPSGVAITGQILDERGNPLKGATVSAWRTIYIAAGERRLSFAGQAVSDDRGDYRIAGVKPGTYFVDAKTSESNAPTFFPATTTASMAAAITVSADFGAASVSIRLLPTPLARVSGTIINAQGQPSGDFGVMLTPQRSDGAQVPTEGLIAEPDAAGKFAIDKVPPGSYSVEVIAKARIQKVASSGYVAEGVEGNESGSQPVVVDGRDVDDLVIRTNLPTLISGKVTVDGRTIGAEGATKLRLRLGSSGPSGARAVLSATFATPNADGTFTMLAIPGARLLRVDLLPPGSALKQVLVNSIDVTDEGFVVGNSAIADVVIALTTTPSQVTGRVSDSQGAMLAHVGVILFPAEPRRWTIAQTRFVKSTKTDKDGAFTVTALPPGSYYAAVVPFLTEGEWAEPANLEKLRVTATSFKLTDGEQKTMVLTLRR